MTSFFSLIRLITAQIIILSCTLFAELSVPAVFSNGMVLQRNMDVSVWGWATEGQDVAVTFADQEIKAKADANGKWMLKLKPMKASAEAQVMSISAGNESIKIEDILIGEVWICSGQSNMDYRLGNLTREAKQSVDQPLVDHIIQVISTHNDPLIRQIAVPKKTSHKQVLTNFEGSWIKAIPDQIKDFTATGYFFAKKLKDELNVPIGLLKCPWGGKRVEPFIPMQSFQNDSSLTSYYDDYLADIDEEIESFSPEDAETQFQKALTKWNADVEAAKAAKKKSPRKPRKAIDPSQDPAVPSTIYNAMIHPLVPYSIKGAIWYQGESNARHYPEDHSHRLQTLIKGWRSAWGQGDFSFYFCQLAGFKAPNPEPQESDDWVTIQDQHRRTLSLKNTGMAVLNDIGEEKDIHPHNKMDAGQRLAAWALAKDYGKDIVFSGPIYKSHQIKGIKVIIDFDHVGSGLMTAKKTLLEPAKETGDPLSYVQICGADRKWVWANATITGKNQISVEHPSVSEPVEVRYAWHSNPVGANLYNKEGFPASCFTTSP